MSEGPVRHCPGCGQALRFPAGIGGMLMACPECGYRFASPFKLAAPAATTKAPMIGASTSIASNGSFPEAAGSPREEAQQSPPPMRQIKENSLAARVAALYAANNR
ncbi:conserved hypothetical protein [Solidesulfovibrio fructosivorans JJ]]|uniref:Uncharacterized protein n=1 Tax=Solidesulfovibrio fructosivorans JJ] TaxID=596151 RepID=E1JUD5_SOLFR|nr:hypothetical protein [Solidesulfovibrio fructosivorans]EFL52065.1 conserved hypothetical protein [Solidesulfovibrio fructosivorans JJ]]